MRGKIFEAELWWQVCGFCLVLVGACVLPNNSTLLLPVHVLQQSDTVYQVYMLCGMVCTCLYQCVDARTQAEKAVKQQ